MYIHNKKPLSRMLKGMECQALPIGWLQNFQGGYRNKKY